MRLSFEKPLRGSRYELRLWEALGADCFHEAGVLTVGVVAHVTKKRNVVVAETLVNQNKVRSIIDQRSVLWRMLNAEMLLLVSLRVDRVAWSS